MVREGRGTEGGQKEGKNGGTGGKVTCLLLHVVCM